MILTSYFFSLNFLREERELESDKKPNGWTHQQLENHFFNNEVATTLNQLLIRLAPSGRRQRK